jgi:hypothetical protein
MSDVRSNEGYANSPIFVCKLHEILRAISTIDSDEGFEKMTSRNSSFYTSLKVGHYYQVLSRTNEVW